MKVASSPARAERPFSYLFGLSIFTEYFYLLVEAAPASGDEVVAKTVRMAEGPKISP